MQYEAKPQSNATLQGKGLVINYKSGRYKSYGLDTIVNKSLSFNLNVEFHGSFSNKRYFFAIVLTGNHEAKKPIASTVIKTRRKSEKITLTG
jgi:hypothetical protein